MKKKKVLLIGNIDSPNKRALNGQNVKINLYIDFLTETDNIVNIFKINQNKLLLLFRLVFVLFWSILNNDVVLLMGGPRGSRFMLPIINLLNIRHRRVVFCAIGTGTLHVLLEKNGFGPQETAAFLKDTSYGNLKDCRMAKALKKCDLILLENQILCDATANFYRLNNCIVLKNYRKVKHTPSCYQSFSEPLPVIFLSRVCSEKGVLDLMDAVNYVNRSKGETVFTLDIYGPKKFSDKENDAFNDSLNSNVRFKGVLDNQDAIINLFSKYFLFAFPTKFPGEGTPGAIVESLLAGTPVLTSSFHTAKDIIQPNVNGYIFDLENKKSLIQSLNYIHENKDLFIQKRKLIQDEALKNYSFDENKVFFLECIFGEE